MNTLKCFALVPAVLLLIAGGCIKRSEKITIFEDGRVVLETEIKGDPDDVYNGDAMPTADSGWQIDDHLETDSEGKKELTRQATREIAAGQALPSSYATAQSRLDTIALQFPTTVTIEHRADGTYYHFRRIYQRREFAMVQYLQDQAMESDEAQAITQKEPEDVTDEERMTLARIFVDIAAKRTATYMEQVGLEMQSQIPQHALLEARRRALAVYTSDELMKQLAGLLREDATDGGLADKLEQDLNARVRRAATESLRELGVPSAAIDDFVERCTLANDAFEITEDLGDESWFVGVTMPGRIVAHNSFGDPSQLLAKMLEPVEQDGVVRQSSISATVAVEKDGRRETVTTIESHESRSNNVAWEFDGKALRDRDVVLMATSFVPHEED